MNIQQEEIKALEEIKAEKTIINEELFQILSKMNPENKLELMKKFVLMSMLENAIQSCIENISVTQHINPQDIQVDMDKKQIVLDFLEEKFFWNWINFEQIEIKYQIRITYFALNKNDKILLNNILQDHLDEFDCETFIKKPNTLKTIEELASEIYENVLKELDQYHIKDRNKFKWVLYRYIFLRLKSEELDWYISDEENLIYGLKTMQLVEQNMLKY